MDKPDGTWLPVPSWEGLYEASFSGLVWSVRRKILLKPWRNKRDGYLYVTFCRHQSQSAYKLHKVIMMTFRGPRPAGTEVCHNDGNKDNCVVSNMRYDTRASNMKDNVRHGKNQNANKAECPRCNGPYSRRRNGQRYQRYCPRCNMASRRAKSA